MGAAPLGNDPCTDLRTRVQADSLNRIAALLGTEMVSRPMDGTAIMELAASRLEKAARMMEQLDGLFKAAQRSGFTGNSAPMMLKFVSEKLDAELSLQRLKDASAPIVTDALPEFVLACEQLEPELAFHEARLNEDPLILRRACLRVIRESAARIEAQRTTIAMLAGPLAASRPNRGL